MTCKFKTYIVIAKLASKGVLPHFAFPPKVHKSAWFPVPLPTRAWDIIKLLIFSCLIDEKIHQPCFSFLSFSDDWSGSSFDMFISYFFLFLYVSFVHFTTGSWELFSLLNFKNSFLILNCKNFQMTNERN